MQHSAFGAELQEAGTSAFSWDQFFLGFGCSPCACQRGPATSTSVQKAFESTREVEEEEATICDVEMESAMPAKKGKADLFSLPDHILCDIFSLTEFIDRVLILPLVCKKVRLLLASSSSAWQAAEWTTLWGTEADAQRTQSFLAWLLPRSRQLRSFTFVAEPPEGPDLHGEAAALLRSVLIAAKAALEFLKLVLPSYTLYTGYWLPAGGCPRLASLFLAAPNIKLEVGSLDGMSSLRQLELFPLDGSVNFPEGYHMPPCLTRVVMVPAPASIPECVLELRQLKYLDIGGSECDGLGQSLDGLSRLTTLNTLALDRCTLNAVPRHVSHLTKLQVLSLHQSMQQGPDQQDNTMLASFTALAGLTALETLSISGCLLSEVPPAVLQLTTLKVLHTEGALRTLTRGPYLRGLRLLCCDWQVLFQAPSTILHDMSSLKRLCLCTWSLPAMWRFGQLHGAQEVLGAIARHPTLSSVAVLVQEGDLVSSSMVFTEFLLRLVGCRARLDVVVVPASAFFLTDGVGSGADLE